jgi:tetratricopeptide (TPR) repeat protein
VELQRDLASGYERAAMLQGAPGTANLGNAYSARDSMQKALTLRQRVLASDPRSIEFRRELAQGYRELSNLQEDNSKLQHAEAALSLIADLRREQPADGKLISEQAMSEHAVAVALTDAERYSDAIGYYRKALSHSTFSVPGNVALYHKRLGALLIQNAQLTEALKEYQAAAGLDEQRVRDRPADGRAKMDLSFDYSDWALILSRTQDLKGALQQYRKAKRIRSEMAAADPHDVRAANALASVSSRLAEVLAASGDRRGSEEEFQRAISHAESIIKTFPETTAGKQQLANAYSRLGVCWRQYWLSCARSREWITRARDLYREIHDEREVQAAEQQVQTCEVGR